MIWRGVCCIGVLDREEFVAAYALHKGASASAFFDAVDANGDGAVDRREFLAATEGSGPLLMSRKEAEAFFKQADSNGDAVLDLGEFVAAYGMYRESASFFTKADANGDGQLDRGEFVGACSSGMLPLNAKQAHEFFKRADTNAPSPFASGRPCGEI